METEPVMCNEEQVLVLNRNGSKEHYVEAKIVCLNSVARLKNLCGGGSKHS